MSPTDTPHDPPDGIDSGYAVFPKDRTTRVDDGTRLAWTVLPAEGGGERTPVLAVNGWSCTDAYWVHIAPALAALGHPVVVVDARGHAASGLPRAPGRGARGLRPEDISSERMARDLLAVLDETDLHEVVVMGHSMGVQIGLELDRPDPDRVAGLVGTGADGHEPVSERSERTRWHGPSGGGASTASAADRAHWGLATIEARDAFHGWMSHQ